MNVEEMILPPPYYGFSEKWNETVRQICFALGYEGDFPSVEKLEELSRPRFKRSDCYIISGISGSGKTTFGKLLEYVSFRKLPTAVVRSPRPGEIQGLDYIFLDEKTFRRWDRKGLFLFSHKTNGVSHGFPVSHLLVLNGGTGKFYLDKSMKSVHNLLPYIESRATFIYLLPPSFEDLYLRIKKREQSRLSVGLSDEEISSRFEEELEEFKKSSSYPYAYFVNENMDSLLNLLSLA